MTNEALEAWVWGQSPVAPETGRDHWRYPYQSVWHYSDVNGLRGIANHHVLWASDAEWMNDPAESSFGIAAFRRGWEAVRPNVIDTGLAQSFEDWMETAERRLSARQTFILCTALVGDSLAIWRTYGGGEGRDGVAIELSASSELRVFDSEVGAEPRALPDWVPSLLWLRVHYGEHTSGWGHGLSAESPMGRFLDSAFTYLAAKRRGETDTVDEQVIERAYAILIRTTKHGAYASEEEARVVTFAPPDLVHSRSGHYRDMVDYVRLTGAERVPLEQYSVTSPEKLPIRSVTIGPSGPDALEGEVRSILDASGYDDVPIKRSSVPMRRRS